MEDMVETLERTSRCKAAREAEKSPGSWIVFPRIVPATLSRVRGQLSHARPPLEAAAEGATSRKHFMVAAVC